jgi:hypothetical protein
MLRRDFVRAAMTIGIAPKLLLAQQQGTPAPLPPAPVPWTLGLNRRTPLPRVDVAENIAVSDIRFFTPLQMQTLTPSPTYWFLQPTASLEPHRQRFRHFLIF